MKKLSLEDFNNRLKEKGIKYTCLVYYNTREITEFSCPELDHPNFYARPDDILYEKKKCPCCTGKITKHTLESFNIKLEEVGIKYRCVDYVAAKKLSSFACPESCHPNFYAYPDDIFRGKKSCPCCTSDRESWMNFRLKSKNIAYTCETYNGSDKKSEFSCPEPDHPNFWCDPDDVFKELRGCPICTNYVERNNWDTESYDKLLLSKNIVAYGFVGSNIKIKHECLVCEYGKDGEWYTKPIYLIYHDSGCPNCADYTFDLNKNAILYYIKIYHNDNILYKIGITTRTIKKRLVGERIKYDVLFSKKYEIGRDAKRVETLILEKYNHHKYDGDKILRYTGNTEIFICDIFGGTYDLTELEECDIMGVDDFKFE
jgi:hypothetical protein